jgi:hypothetical protein
MSIAHPPATTPALPDRSTLLTLFGSLLGICVFTVGFLLVSGTVHHWFKSKPATPVELVESWKKYGMWLLDDCEVQFLRSRLPESLVDLRRGISETHEVRGGARIEKHFVDLQKTLRVFGFDVITDADCMMALHKCEDGTVIDGMGPIRC